MFSVLPQCKDRDTNWAFSVDTFTSTKSTHWQNSNELATRPKVPISSLKANEVVCVAEPGQPACNIEEHAEGGVHTIAGEGG